MHIDSQRTLPRMLHGAFYCMALIGSMSIPLFVQYFIAWYYTFPLAKGILESLTKRN